MDTALVIENDPSDDPRRLGEWLTEAGLRLDVLRPYAGDALPPDLDGYAALVVLGGEQSAYPPRAPWFDDVEALLRKATRHGVPTLGVCLGAQLLATAHGGVVERSAAGPEIGPALVGRRDAAESDLLFRYVPLAPDVLQWHLDEIVELPAGAVLLAASTRYPHQAFRLGERAWGLQFHIECDTAMIADWARSAPEGYEAEDVIAACDAVMVDVEEVWQPFAARFAALALGQLRDARRPLPILGQ
ncbi:type 1 glutamine amidotransferase [Phytohabitans rumicis]|uniref:Glutamine amidotransferase n=1 Tax=Phytohabitans rumicis TaxID=1076125 RepID=A0A6V8L7W8_9ACTN|nr:type 1 glutamine amidotransferase [Phytohabitans rumicis]GFJ92374.1 glutamine amidotransferase [Phytohabitans rumicis]